jgi:serine protease Do
VVISKNKGFIAGAAIGLAVAGGAIAWGAGRGAAPVNALPMAPAEPPPGAPQSFANIFQRVSPAVVSIDITGHAQPSEVALEGGDGQDGQSEGGGQAVPFPFPFSFGFQGQGGSGQSQQFGPAQPDRHLAQKIQATGSGFFISPTGYIVTNDHVVKDADTITVRTADRRVFKAHLVGKDPATDLAVIKVDGGNFPYVTFEDSAKPRVGDWVVAVGNPFDLGGTATAGIISALGRENLSDSHLVDYMQIDAPINRGNSGGPTFDVYGRVVGVNTMIYSPSGGSVGIGFDIPADVVSSITKQLIATGKVSHGYIGATIQGITPELSESLGLKTTDGALVAQLTPGGPAERSGLQVGDVVLAMNGRTVTSATELTQQVAFSRPGDTLRLTILRDGRQQSVDLHAGLRPSEAVLARNDSGGGVQNAEPGSAPATAPKVLGMRLAQLNDAERQRFNLDDSAKGVIVESVGENSDAAGKGLQPGDIILRAGTRAASQPSEVVAAVADARKAQRKDVLLRVSRGGQTLFVPVQVTGQG